MKTLIYLFAVAMSLFAGCAKDEINMYNDPNLEEIGSLKSAKPEIKIAFIGGLSYLDPSLMNDCFIEGSDFMKTISSWNGVPELIKPILDQALTQILTEKPDLLFITGELSFRGEKISHEGLAAILKNISDKGIKVFIIPGNADVNNPRSTAFNGNSSSPTPTVSDEEFENIYKDFGFKDAISRDPSSMSYLTEVFNNLWILGIDSRIYPVTKSGLIKPETMEWIKFWLAEANKKNITVLALCHHEITEPFAETAIYASAYVIKNHESAENELTDAGLRVIFGAYANDIAMFSKGENVLYSVCAEYLDSPPHAYRMIKMEPNSMKIETRYVTSINEPIPGGVNLLDYSNSCYQIRTKNMYIPIFNSPPYNRPRGDDSTPGTADYYALHFAKAMRSFYGGDEQFPTEAEETSQTWPEPYKHVLKSIYTDLPPKDLQYTVDMRKKLRE